MGNHNSNSFSMTQDVVNNVLEDQENDCSVQNNVRINGNVITIDNSNISGDVYGISDNGTSADASCTIVSSMNTTITDALQAQGSQTNKTASDLFGDFSYSGQDNSANIFQSTVNNIALLSQTLCQADQMTSVSNNFVFYNNLNVGGNLFGISIDDSSAQASCTMSNTMNFSLYNSFSASVSQSNTNIGMFVILILAIAGVVGLAIIGATIVFSVNGIGGLIPKGKEKTPEEVVQDDIEKLEASMFEKQKKVSSNPEEEGIELSVLRGTQEKL
jgi:hypothetical protein